MGFYNCEKCGDTFYFLLEEGEEICWECKKSEIDREINPEYEL